ncbi:unnamed protein product [Orchesella dallaii]|uniref:Peptidase M14 domain-containing protein n=1 Tax=Orchesella dallaii TaxID=48710 RepID=A0ABP1QK10_9HEXA
MLKARGLILLGIALTVATIIASEKRYSGYKVYTVKKARNDTEYKALLELQKNFKKVDFWSDPSKRRPTDIMVSPEDLTKTEQFLSSHGLEYSVAINDVQRVVEKENVRSTRQSGMNWRDYQRLRTIHDWLDSLAAFNPQVAQTGSIGRSTEGRNLKMIKLSKNPEKKNPVIYIDGGIHAREWISPAVTTYIIGKLMSLSPQDADLLENVDWHIVPVLNPDGYEYTFNEDRLWRKSRSLHNGPNCPGVDLNRNFDFHWGEAGTNDDPCRNTYPGPYPFSEPEANSTASYLFNNRNKIRAYLTFHSYSQLWLTPYGYTEDLPSDYEELESLGLRAARALQEVYGTEYEVGAPSHILYLYSGSSQDWAREYGNVKYSYTIELRDDGDEKFLLSPENILPTCEETWEAVKVVARYLVENRKTGKDTTAAKRPPPPFPPVPTYIKKNKDEENADIDGNYDSDSSEEEDADVV